MTHAIDHAIFRVATSLEVPVLLLALLALALVVVELGAFAVEVRRRLPRSFARLADAGTQARAAVDRGDRAAAREALEAVSWSRPMLAAVATFVEAAGGPDADTVLAKTLADIDFDATRRLGRTRLLVRAGPALGLMGTLIPLSPALDGLARGDLATLSTDLRVAFSVTVLGLLVGAVAFGLSLTRDRLYGQDLSDLEYLAARLTAPAVTVDPAPAEPAAASRPTR
jgi:biopolymer transport protein ExbB/TolQ